MAYTEMALLTSWVIKLQKSEISPNDYHFCRLMCAQIIYLPVFYFLDNILTDRPSSCIRIAVRTADRSSAW